MKLCCRTALSIAAISLGCLPAVTAAQDSSHTLTVMDEFQLQTAVDPQISPDGKKIVYVRRFADPMTDKRYSNLWVINADGTDHRPISTGNHSYTSPRWSPDGTRLAYFKNEDGDPLFVADRTGADARQILVHKGGHSHNPVWSSDSQWIYFAGGLEPTDAMDVFRVRPSGESLERLTERGTAVNFIAPIDARSPLASRSRTLRLRAISP